MYIVPTILLAAMHQSARGCPLRRLGLVSVVMVGVLAIGGFVVTMQRTTFYSGEGWMRASEMVAATERGSGISHEVAGSFGELIGGRLGGIDVFFALMAGPGTQPDPWVPIRLFIGDDQLSRGMIQEALGFLPSVSGGLAFGIGFTLWGVLGLGGAVFIPFLGSALLVVWVCSIEGLLSRYGQEGMGAVLGSLVALSAWDAPNLLYVSRQAVVVLVAFLLARQESRTLARRSAGSP